MCRRAPAHHIWSTRAVSKALAGPPTVSCLILSFASSAMQGDSPQAAELAGEASSICDSLGRKLDAWEMQRLLGGPYDDRVKPSLSCVHTCLVT